MMGLLTQMLAGGIAQAADTTASMMMKDHDAALQTERDNAQALREENLTRLRASLVEQSADKQRGFETHKLDTEYNRGPSGMVDASTGLPLNREEAKKAAPDTTISPEDDKIDPNHLVNGKPASAWEVKVALQDKPESVTRVKEVDADTRVEAMKEVAQMKIDNATKIADMKLENARTLLNAKIAAGHSEDSVESKKIMAEIKKAEEQRKAADSAAKLLDKTGGDMNPEQTKLYNGFLRMAGAEDDVKPIPAAKVKEKPKGLLGTVKSFFGSDDAQAAPTPAKAAPIAVKKPDIADVDAQAQAAIMKVNASNIPYAEKLQKLRAIQARRNQITGS